MPTDALGCRAMTAPRVVHDAFGDHIVHFIRTHHRRRSHIVNSKAVVKA